jgi:SAM-dependent methyltransferase
LKLNLGCGAVPIEGFLNVDNRPLPWVNQIVDLNKRPWPWPAGSVEKVVAIDVLEHLYPAGRVEGQMNIVAVLGEIHRILKPGGELLARIPSTNSLGAFQDPTHVTYWNRNTWWYFAANSDLRPDLWPPFDVDLREEIEEEQAIKWVLVKAKKVGYDEIEVRKRAQHKVDSSEQSGGTEPENPS